MPKRVGAVLQELAISNPILDRSPSMFYSLLPAVEQKQKQYSVLLPKLRKEFASPVQVSTRAEQQENAGSIHASQPIDLYDLVGQADHDVLDMRILSPTPSDPFMPSTNSVQQPFHPLYPPFMGCPEFANTISMLCETSESFYLLIIRSFHALVPFRSTILSPEPIPPSTPSVQQPFHPLHPSSMRSRVAHTIRMLCESTVFHALHPL